MKTITLQVIFGIIAIVGALVIYLLKDSEILASTFVALVWAVYERLTKEDVKTNFKEAVGKSVAQYKADKQ